MQEIKAENLQTKNTEKSSGPISGTILSIVLIGLFGIVAYEKSQPVFGFDPLGLVLVPFAFIGLIIAITYLTLSSLEILKEGRSPNFTTIFGLVISGAFIISYFWMVGLKVTILLFKLLFAIITSVFK